MKALLTTILITMTVAFPASAQFQLLPPTCSDMQTELHAKMQANPFNDDGASNRQLGGMLRALENALFTHQQMKCDLTSLSFLTWVFGARGIMIALELIAMTDAEAEAIAAAGGNH
jgi:hypothetical protein